MQNQVFSHPPPPQPPNTGSFHIKGFSRRLDLKQRHKVNRVRCSMGKILSVFTGRHCWNSDQVGVEKGGGGHCVLGEHEVHL